MAELGDVYADFEQDIERFTALRESIAPGIAQVVALEAGLEQIRMAMDE